MKIYDIYAFVKDGKVYDVRPFASGAVDLATMRARAVLGDEAYAVQCTDYYVMIGDTFENGNFYHEGELVPYGGGTESKIVALNSRISGQSKEIDDLIVAILEG